MSDEGVVYDPYAWERGGKRPSDPGAGPRQKRALLEYGRFVGDKSDAAQLAKEEADLAARAPTAAPRVGITNTTKTDPRLMRLIAERMRGK